MRLFTILDGKAEAYLRPFTSQTRATAMREVSVGLKNDQTMTQYAVDFSVWEIGTFDITSGRITAQEPYHVCQITDLVQAGEMNEQDNESQR